MPKTPYFELLKDPRWQKKRLWVFERDGFKCTNCFREDLQLHAHHRYYVSGRMPWDYPPFCYQTLCSECHSAGHDKSQSDESRATQRWELACQWFSDGRLRGVSDLSLALQDLWDCTENPSQEKIAGILTDLIKAKLPPTAMCLQPDTINFP